MSFTHHLRRIHAATSHLGFNPLGLLALRHIPGFMRDMDRYRRMARHQPQAMPLELAQMFPILTDKSDAAGTSRSHYFQMDLWMARHVIAAAPKQHLDVGSRLDGFIGHLLAAGQPVTMVDIRPLPNPPEGLDFRQDDATKLATLADGTVKSLSSLHAAEHFGLGRYNDPVDPLACYTFMRAMARVLAPGGRLYFATPIGRERVEFNAHRVFSPHTLQRVFEEEAGLSLVQSAVITSKGQLVDPANPLGFDAENFACGLYVYTKK